MATNARRVALDKIMLDPRLQARAQLSDELVGEYAQAMDDGSKFPPLEVWKIDDELFLVDGFHRLGALRANGKSFHMTRCVGEGTIEDAQLYGLGVNSRNGQRLTNADKNRVVKLALVHPALQEASAREIARACGVTHVFVSKLRHFLETVPPEVRERITKGEQTANPLTPPKGDDEPEGDEGSEDPFDGAVRALNEASATARRLLKSHGQLRDRIGQMTRQTVVEIERLRPVQCPECERSGEKGCAFCGFSGKVPRHVAGKRGRK